MALIFFGTIATVVTIYLAWMYRVIVPTNMVHIVQSRKRTTPYGSGQSAGNVYYGWPSWVPWFGVTVIRLPVSNFDLSLRNYEAYDKDRVPFMVDVTAFFRVDHPETAAQRVATFEELQQQLLEIVRGTVRKVLASDVIDQIMLERAKFGASFTLEVKDQLKEWGVSPVKSMELMDIRDGQDSRVIANIMAKKTSQIEMESRVEVAENRRKGDTAEIEAKQAVDIRDQEAQQAVGERTAEKEKMVGVAKQQAEQEILTQSKETQERAMSVRRVEEVRQAEITKDREIVAADQDKQTTILVADGKLAEQHRVAEGIKAVGLAKAAAEQAMQMAPVVAQIALAKEIGSNEGYQQYLAIVKAVDAHVIVGTKNAEALRAADVKVIANTGRAGDGIATVGDVFSTEGGTKLGAAVEAFAQTPLGKAVLDKIGVTAQAAPAAIPPEKPLPPIQG